MPMHDENRRHGPAHNYEGNFNLVPNYIRLREEVLIEFFKRFLSDFRGHTFLEVSVASSFATRVHYVIQSQLFSFEILSYKTCSFDSALYD